MAYEGYNGQIEVDGDVLVVTRTGMMARTAFGKDVPPRRIPLQAISGVRFKEATRLGNGWLQLILGGVEGQAATAKTAASDPDVVLFTHAKRESFDQLHQWLLAVIDHNRSQGINSAEVEFDAGQSRQKPSAEVEQKRAEQNMERYGAGGDRPDIAEAASRMGRKMGGKRELKKLPEHLSDTEKVRFIAQGTYEGNQGIVVLTDQRLLFVFHGLMSQSVEDFPLDRISSVASKAGVLSGDLTVHASGNIAVIANILKADLKFLVDALRQRLAEGATGGAVPAAPAQPDVMDQLRRLGELRDAGILTPEEFESKKTELLGRL